MNDFTYRYAIRRPDGELVLKPKPLNIFGSLFGEQDTSEPLPQVWDVKEEAEAALATLKRQAAQLGIGEWLGVVVQSLCTPFTTHDPAEQFAQEVQEWLSQEG